MGSVYPDGGTGTDISEAWKIAYCKTEAIHYNCKSVGFDYDCTCHGDDSFESDLGPVDSALRDLLEHDRGAEDQCAQLLRAELVGVDRGSWQGRIGIAGNPYVIMGLHDIPIDRGTRPSLGRTRTSNCYLRVSGGIGASL